MLGALAILVSTSTQAQGPADWNTAGNFGLNPVNSFLGTTDGVPINFRTNNIKRMRLTETLTGQAVNGYTTLDLSGHLGIGNFNAPVYTPLAMLHLDSMGSEVAGYRSYMGTGVLMTSLSDMMYVGLKRLSDDRINSVINWADNALQQGPDLLKFIFLANNKAGDRLGIKARSSFQLM